MMKIHFIELFFIFSLGILANAFQISHLSTTSSRKPNRVKYNSFKMNLMQDDPLQQQEKKMMEWPLNFIEKSPFLTGELAGDAGFDPLRIIKSKEQLFLYREAEIKHARLAMLASLGWPGSELYHFTFSKEFHLDNLLAIGGKAPSILNGGLDNYYVLCSLSVFFAIGAYLEYFLAKRRAEVPENLRNFFDMWREDGWDLPGLV